MRIVAKLIAPVALAVFAGSAEAQTWDLKTDWSNTSNPNGVWTYLVNGSAPSSPGTRGCDSFGPPGPPPIGGSCYVGWSQSNGSESFGYDLQVGDIYGHDNPGGPIAIDWTSPFAGLVNVTGGAWMLRDIGRANDWSVTFNNAVQASGTIFSGDPWDRTNPASFSFSTAVQVGDVLQFAFLPSPGMPYGDYSGVNLTVSAVVATPEPASAALIALGLGVLLPVLTRRTRTPGI